MICTVAKCYEADQIKQNEKNGARYNHENVCKFLDLMGLYQLAVLDLESMITLKCTTGGHGIIHQAQHKETMVGCCEKGHEPLGFINDCEFLEYVKD